MINLKHPGAYFIFPVIGAALIRERHLFDSGTYFNYRQNTEGIPGIWRELSEVRTRYAQFNIKYVHLKLSHEPSFKSFPRLKLKNSRVGRGLISQATWC